MAQLGPTADEWEATLQFEREQTVRQRARLGLCVCCGEGKAAQPTFGDYSDLFRAQWPPLWCERCFRQAADTKLPCLLDLSAEVEMCWTERQERRKAKAA